MFFILFQIKSVLPSVTGLKPSKYLHFFLKDIFVVLQTCIFFLSFFTILVTKAAPHVKFSTRVSPSIISTQQ